MAAVNDVPQLVDKKGSSYAAIAPKLEPPKTAEGDAKPDFEGPSDTKENRIMDLKLEYQIFREKSTESLSQTYTRYKTMLNELANDGVNLTKHKINISMKGNSDDEVDERTSEEYLRDLDIKYHERAFLANSKCHFARDYFSKTSKPSYKSPVNNYSSVSKGFQPKFTPKLIQSTSNSNKKDYKAEYKTIKAKLALLEASPSSSQNPKTFQPKNKGLVAKTFDLDEEEVSDKEEVTQVKVSQCISEQIPHQKKKVLGGELLTESSSKKNENENLFIPASIRYDQEIVSKTKDWVERLNPDNKLPNFNTGRILVPQSQAVNESLETSNTPESSKDSEAEFLTPLPPLKTL
ncbi:hypothetical protein Tco_0416934 [Tanacetum coccineum]